MTPAPTRRRPPEGGYARGDETRRRIVTTALRLFAERGFEGVSTREIAAEAEVNPPALQYYFDSKDGLYRACAEHVADGVLELVEPRLRRAEQLLEDGAPAPALIEAYCAIIEPLIDIVFEEEGAFWSPFIAAEEGGRGPCTAFPILRERIIDRAERIFTALIARIGGLPADAPATQLRAQAINGQFMVFHTKRHAFEPFTPEHGRTVKAIVVDQTRVLLNHLAAGRG
jgi:AcrR family transcriptional regulator